MRPLNHTSSSPAITLDEIAVQLRAERVMVLATLPSGDLRVVRVGRGPGGAAWSPAMSRQYLAAGQFDDAASWNAILDLEPDGDGEEESRTIVACLAGPLLAGYPGVLIAVAGADRPAFNDDDRDRLVAAAARLELDPTFAASRRLGDAGKAAARLFVYEAGSGFLGISPSEADLDPTLAANVEEFARTRSADSSAATGGERVLLADATGQLHAFTIAIYNEHRALAPKGGRVLLIMRVPHFTEWLGLRPEDFPVDAEIGRLLPAFRFMKDRFHEGVILPAIAKHVALSPFHFHRRFTELLGITPKHFLYDAQIARAQEYLLASTHELEEVAKLCGFAHQSHFTSRFKQATGLTPTRWRRLKLAGDRSTARSPARV